MAHHGHGILTLVSFDRNDVTPLANTDHGAVHATTRRVNADNDRRSHVLIFRPFERILDQRGRYKLVLTRGRELTIDLHPRLTRVVPILSNDLVVDGLVGALHRPGVNHLPVPKRPLAVERLKEVPGVTPWVRERQPVPVQYLLCKEPRRHAPDAIRYA